MTYNTEFDYKHSFENIVVVSKMNSVSLFLFKRFMAQFIIHAKDFVDAEAPARRANARPFHLQRMKEEKQKGVFILGGALLNEQNEMIGSVIIVALSNTQSVERWIQQDPYVMSKVWDEITITPFRVAVV